MILVGLTGGIGSGKSTVSSALADRGAVIVDADQVVRDVQRIGSPVLEKLAERFGAEVIAADGSLDRAALAGVAFADPEALGDLNAIVHPAVGAEMNRQVMEHVATDDVVVLDIPLLTENPRDGLQGIIVVDVPVEVQVARLVQFRGFDEADARARIARQATRELRLATASFVVDNSGEREELEPQIAELWVWLQSLPQLPADYQFAGRKDRTDREGAADAAPAARQAVAGEPSATS
ncbi:MAG: dephospho-CoA kinase [Ilumatobacteraceae bacterium]